ncbi:MAG: hypothetical protein ACKVQU_25785 [Burkholderiales bacterium]
MDSRAVAFVEVMAAIGILGLVVFLIILVSRQTPGVHAMGRAVRDRPRWVALLLALLAVLICAVLVLWQFGLWTSIAGAARDGESSSRGLLFFVVMMIIGAAGLILFLVAMFWRSDPQSSNPVAIGPASHATTAAAPAPVESAKASHETPSATRLLGLLGFGIAYLIVNGSSVPYAQQYQMMLHLMYPAGFIIALVMMLDKASRVWHVKPPGETFREWLYCDALLVLYLFGYLNLLSVGAMEGAGESYRAMFWDFLHVVGLLLVLWLVDRKTWRLRFLFANAWLVLLPLLLLIWRNAHGVVMAEPVSWWGTIWPFFILALVFFVLEVIVLIADRDNANQGAGTTKDLVFIILYVIFLIAGRPVAVT